MRLPRAEVSPDHQTAAGMRGRLKLLDKLQFHARLLATERAHAVRIRHAGTQGFDRASRGELPAGRGCHHLYRLLAETNQGRENILPSAVAHIVENPHFERLMTI